jgi:hypothetical protein
MWAGERVVDVFGLARGRKRTMASARCLTTDRIWRVLEKTAFAVISLVHPAGSGSIESVSKKVASLLPPERKNGCLLELAPEGAFLTYGVGVSLRDMAKPAAAIVRVPVS